MLDVQIITPDRLVLTDQVDSVVAPAVDGEVGILTGHTPLLVRLGMGELRLKKKNDTQYFAIHDGLLKVQTGNKVSVFAETAEMAGEIDLERAELSKEKIEKQLKETKDLSVKELAALESALGRAVTRLKLGSVKRRKPPQQQH